MNRELTAGWTSDVGDPLENLQATADYMLSQRGLKQLPLFADIQTIHVNSLVKLTELSNEFTWRTASIRQGRHKFWYCLQGDSSHIKAFYYEVVSNERLPG